MGHRNSKAYTEAINKLSSLELQNITAVFNELSTENKDGTREIPEPNMATRRVFAERFCLPGLIGERLFHAFDQDNTGTIDLEEFVGGVALCLHGSAEAKCELLFRVFNFSDDAADCVTEDELKTILLSALQSANTILDSVQDGDVVEIKENEKPLIETVAEIVQDAFKTCDKSNNGKLSAKEFSNWLHKKPEIMDNIFGWQCPQPELGQWANEPEQRSPQPDTGGSRKSLQNLFGGDGNQDGAGESFFDTLSVPADNPTVDQHVIGKDSEKNMETLDNVLSVENKPVVDETLGLDDNHIGDSNESSCVLPDDVVPPVQRPSSPVQRPTPRRSGPFPSKADTEACDHFHHIDAIWLPSYETHSVLEAIKNGSLQSENVKLSQVIPCSAVDVPQVDPVKELITKYLSNNDEDPKRTMPTEDTVSCDESGLKQLLEAECWRAALNLTAKLLENYGKNVSQVLHSPKSLEIWFCRIALLFQLKMHSVAEVELEAFGNLDSAKFYYEFYPDLYPEKQGSMVPFCFRILHALLPQHAGRPKETLDKLFYVHSVCLQVLNALSKGDPRAVRSNHTVEECQKGIKLWEKRLLQVLYCIGNTFVMLKEYNLAITIFKQIAKKDSENSRALFSGIGRISLQSGDIQSAQFYFKCVEDIDVGDGTSPDTDVLVNRGLLALALDAYEEAYKHFLAAKNIDPKNFVAVNNAAVSLLFQGRLKDALELLEVIVLQHPETTLQEGVLFNVCTMYELETSHHLQKKHKLLGLVGKYKGDSFNVSSLKFP